MKGDTSAVLKHKWGEKTWKKSLFKCTETWGCHWRVKWPSFQYSNLLTVPNTMPHPLYFTQPVQKAALCLTGRGLLFSERLKTQLDAHLRHLLHVSLVTGSLLPSPALSAVEKDLRCVHVKSWIILVLAHELGWRPAETCCNARHKQCFPSASSSHIVLIVGPRHVAIDSWIIWGHYVEQPDGSLRVFFCLCMLTLSAFFLNPSVTCNREKRNHWYAASCWQLFWNSDRSNLLC